VRTVLALLVTIAACKTQSAHVVTDEFHNERPPDLPAHGGRVVLLLPAYQDPPVTAAARAVLADAGYVVDDQTRFRAAIETAYPELLAADEVPNDVPALLAPAWSEGFAACRAQAGPRGPYDENPLAISCRDELVPALLERRWVLEESELVFVVAHDANPARSRDNPQFAVDAFVPGSTRVRSAYGATPVEALEQVLHGHSAKGQRAVHTDLPEAPDENTEALHAGRPWAFEPIHVGACPNQLPAKLILTPDVPLTMSIARAWTKVRPELHTLPDSTCTARAFLTTVRGQPHIAGWLDCEGLDFEVQRVAYSRYEEDLDDPVANLAKALVDQLAFDACSSHASD
jgi:hypothetical protein